EFAAIHNDLALAEMLLVRGEDVNGRDRWGNTPLYCAGNTEMIRWLLNHHADINVKGNQGNTALMPPAQAWLPNLRLLLARGGDPNVRNAFGQRALIWACQFQGDYPARTGVVAELLQHGAEVNARDRRGRTALWWARSVKANASTMERLQRAGARE